MTTNRTASIPACEVPASKGSRRGRSFGLLASVFALALLVTGCTGGPGDQDDFVDVLTLNDNFTEAEATCIAEAVFDEYGEDGVEGFDDFFTGTVSSCTTVGPTVDS